MKRDETVLLKDILECIENIAIRQIMKEEVIML